MKNLILILAIISSQHITVLAQQMTVSQILGLNKELYINVDRLNFRAEPSIKAPILKVLEKGFVLENIDTSTQNTGYYDGINGHEGYWISVRHDETEGYIFSPYVCNQINLVFPSYPMQKIPATPYYYGLTYKADGDYLESIDVKIEKSEDYGPSMETLMPANADGDYQFVLASWKALKTGKTGIFSQFKRADLDYLRPGDSRRLYYKIENSRAVNPLQLVISGHYKFERGFLYLENAALHLFRGKGQSLQTQNLNEIMPFLTYHEAVEIIYYGDLDGDNKLDLILLSYEKVGRTTLLLSSKAKASDFLGIGSLYLGMNGC